MYIDWIRIDWIGEEHKIPKSQKPATKSIEKRHEKKKDSCKTLTLTGKSSNMYRLTKEEDVKMRRNAITSAYKKTNSNIKKELTLKENKLWKMYTSKFQTEWTLTGRKLVLLP